MEQNIAQVALSAATYAIDKPYSYRIPPELMDRVQPGMRVLVPFGAGNRSCDGVVLGLSSVSREERKLKNLLTVLDDAPMLDHDSIQLALWMREQCFCTVYDAARAMLPAGLWFSLRDSWKLAPGTDWQALYDAAGRSKKARHLVDLLHAGGGSAEMERIRAAFGVSDPSDAIKLLSSQGLIVYETSTQRGVGDKTEQVAVLSLPPEEALTRLQSSRKRAPLQYAAAELLCQLGSVSVKELCYFTGASKATVKALAKKGILTLEKQEALRRPALPEVVPLPEAGPPEIVLNEEQQAAFERLDALSASGRPEAALLYGVTGSGKTQVYLKLIRSVLDRGKTALVLVPEIALTPQLLRLFTARFGRQIALLHSALSAGERCDEWKRARRGEARVVVGTRSAVFAPLPDLGLIILDEEQEGAYKSENTPRYHARDAAKYRCARANALLVLGSATPCAETMYAAKEGRYHLLTLKRRFNEHALPQVTIVDLKQELKEGAGGAISRPLREELAKNIRNGEQSILFLNRRGASPSLACGECGCVPECPNCSVHLTYHLANRRLMCHYCGHSEPLPEQCPQCGGVLAQVGFGTQKVQEELETLFPGVEVLRMDADTISATQTHEKLLSRFERQKIPILVGTQMVAKGLDFENVTLVGVISADQSLYVDDYRAGERTFSLLTQVVGRAGRGEKTGRAVIQTWAPGNEVIACAARQDYDAFYEQEISLRRLRGFPPFLALFRVTASGTKEEEVIRCCLRLRQALGQALESPEYAGTPHRLLGPSPAPVAKVNNRFRYRLTLSAPNSRGVRGLLAYMVRRVQEDKQNQGVSVYADHDPMD